MKQNGMYTIFALFALWITIVWSLMGCGAGIVPTDLQTIEGTAEDIIDFAPNGDWEKIASDVTAINAAWSAYQHQDSSKSVSTTYQDMMNTAINDLETASQAKDAHRTMQSANDISAIVIELFAIYSPVVPADIGRLDVLERQIVLDVDANDLNKAKMDLTKVNSVWSNVKPSVLEHKGQGTAKQFEASLIIQETALNDEDISKLISEVNNGLEIVDALEKVYETKKDSKD